MKSIETLPSIESLREYLSYDQITGVIKWKKRRRGIRLGSEAGKTTNGVYRKIKFNGALLKYHRVAWAIYYGEWPNGHIDHIDGDGLNNSISNLRQCNQSQNSRNMKMTSANTSGVKGITWHKKANKWMAQIMLNRKNHYIGLFEDILDAEIAVVNSRKILHGEFARHY